ncbi:MAG TPA: RNA polymerase subunit sigma [Gammaproteobacteria bacterium]|jgi:RNA polymerase sigma-70 factor (ECF subfamily)|nr:RNA polymerase subunit sigma [Gammaproteobacteria bacterium]
MSKQELVLQQQVQHLYAENHGWLLRRLRARLDCSQQAADFAQDTFVRILAGHNASERIEIREPRSYLATIANRVLIDHFRRRALEKAYLEALQSQPEAVVIAPEERLALLQCLHALDDMLSGLGSNVKRAFLLSQLQGLPYAEIAQQLGVSVSSVKKYMAKATSRCLVYALEHGL